MPTGKPNFGRFDLEKEIPWELHKCSLKTSIPLGIEIPLGFITPTEKSNFGRF